MESMNRLKNLKNKLNLWLAGTSSKGNLFLYEGAKRYCSEICCTANEYEYLIKYLTKRLRI